MSKAIEFFKKYLNFAVVISILSLIVTIIALNDNRTFFNKNEIRETVDNVEITVEFQRTDVNGTLLESEFNSNPREYGEEFFSNRDDNIFYDFAISVCNSGKIDTAVKSFVVRANLPSLIKKIYGDHKRYVQKYRNIDRYRVVDSNALHIMSSGDYSILVENRENLHAEVTSKDLTGPFLGVKISNGDCLKTTIKLNLGSNKDLSRAVDLLLKSIATNSDIGFSVMTMRGSSEFKFKTNELMKKILYYSSGMTFVPDEHGDIVPDKKTEVDNAVYDKFERRSTGVLIQ